jgi:hypothetical protein
MICPATIAIASASKPARVRALGNAVVPQARAILQSMEARQRRPARRKPEADLQKAVVKALRLKFKDWVIHGSLMGVNLGPRKGAEAKAMGCLAGWPDLTCISPDGEVSFIELKSPDKNITESSLSLTSRRPSARCAAPGRSLRRLQLNRQRNRDGAVMDLIDEREKTHGPFERTAEIYAHLYMAIAQNTTMKVSAVQWPPSQ